MELVGVAFRFALRNRVRALISALGVGVTVLAFLILRTLIVNWYTVNEEVATTDRFIIRHKVAITFPLYTHQADKIRALPGVLDVSWMCWFVGTYRNERDNFTQLAVDAESYLRMYPEYLPPSEQLADWLSDPAGAMVGADLAKKYGFKIGDHVVLNGTIYPGVWDFTVRAIYPGGSAETDRGIFFLHWKYLNEKLPGGNHVQRLLAKVSDPAAAKRIDAMFVGSETPTKTESELEVHRQWAQWGSAVASAMNLASLVILLVLGLVLGNAMAMATRESTREYATMRALGFRPRHIVVLIVGEGLIVTLVGAVAAVLVAPAVLRSFRALLENRLGGTWELKTDAGVTILAVLVALFTGMLGSALPAWRLTRLDVIEALRRVA